MVVYQSEDRKMWHGGESKSTNIGLRLRVFGVDSPNLLILNFWVSCFFLERKKNDGTNLRCWTRYDDWSRILCTWAVEVLREIDCSTCRKVIITIAGDSGGERSYVKLYVWRFRYYSIWGCVFVVFDIMQHKLWRFELHVSRTFTGFTW